MAVSVETVQQIQTEILHYPHVPLYCLDDRVNQECLPAQKLFSMNLTTKIELEVSVV